MKSLNFNTLNQESNKQQPDEDDGLTFVVHTGETFQVTRRQIQKHVPADSLIARMIDPHQQMQVKDKNGRFKLDYNCKNYDKIFQYLRTGQWSLYDLDTKFERNEQIRIDFDYFQIQLPSYWTTVHEMRSEKLAAEAENREVAAKFAYQLIVAVFTYIDNCRKANIFAKGRDNYLDVHLSCSSYGEFYLDPLIGSRTRESVKISLTGFTKQELDLIGECLSNQESAEKFLKQLTSVTSGGAFQQNGIYWISGKCSITSKIQLTVALSHCILK